MNQGLLSVDEALERLLAGTQPLADTQVLPTLEACGRVLAEDLHSTMNVPSMDNSSMDGYALRSADATSQIGRAHV